VAVRLGATILGLGLVLFVTGCGQESALRKRAQNFTKLLVEEQFDAAVDYYDPDIVTAKGRTHVAGAFKLVVGVAKGLNQIGGRTVSGFQLRKVDFDSAKTRAVVQVVYFTTDAKGDNSKETPTDRHWVLKNKTWYATE
jgi:hypothetical protein